MVLPNFQKDNTNPRPASDWIAAGFETLLPIKAGTKRPAMGGWQRVALPLSAYPEGCGLGLRHDQTVMIDIDVDDEETVAAIRDAAFRHLGAGPVRTGRAPKIGILYRAGSGLEASRVGDVEIRHGAGQQTLVDAIHPVTKRAYTWDLHPVDVGFGGLPMVERAALEAFREEIAGMLGVDAGSAGVTAAGPVPQGAGDTDFDILASMDNPDLAYDDWIAVMTRFKAAVGDTPEARQAILDWGDKSKKHDAIETLRKWASLRTDRLSQTAFREAHGPASALGMTVVPHVDPYAGPDFPAELRPWWWVRSIERFVHHDTLEKATPTALDRLMANKGYALRGAKTAQETFFRHPNRQEVARLTYEPGEPRIIVKALEPGQAPEDADKALNTWQAPKGAGKVKERAKTITDADVRPFIDHWEYLVPCPIARKTFFDWMAYVIQQPGLKPNWALFLGGKQGIGKDLGFGPLVKAVGQHNTATVAPAELQSDYTSWVAEKRLVMIQEMRSFETRLTMNKLKMFITRPPEMIVVNEKFVPRYELPNIAAFVFMSNFEDALSLEESDRRYFVYWSPAEPRPALYYDLVAPWLEAHADDVAAWLYARPLPSFDAAGRAPDSEDKAQMIADSRPEWERMVENAADDDGYPFNGGQVIVKNIEDWLKGMPGLKRRPSRRDLSRTLARLGFEKTGDRVRLEGLGRVDIWTRPVDESVDERTGNANVTIGNDANAPAKKLH